MTNKQKKLLALLREVDGICRKHGLRYVMAGGSLIGVLRNEGFIPWDDDIDIYMPRDDWDRFCALKEEFPPFRCVESVELEREYSNTFPRYGSTDSCSIHKHQIISNDNAGDIIDVLTLDPIPDDDASYRKYLRNMMIYSELVNPASVFGSRYDISSFLYIFYLLGCKLLGKDRIYKKLEKEMFSWPEEECRRFAMRWGGCPFLFEKDMMFPVKNARFEDLEVMVPNRVSDYLIWHYGDEWCMIPPHAERESHDTVEAEGMDFREFRELYMPKAPLEKIRRDRVWYKLYFLFTAKKRHFLFDHRVQSIASFTGLETEKKVQNSRFTLQELKDSRNHTELEQLFSDYYRVQLDADTAGREDFANIYRFQHPALVPLKAEILETAVWNLFYTERLAKAKRILDINASFGELTSALKEIGEAVNAFRNVLNDFEHGDLPECRLQMEPLMARWEDNPSFEKFYLRLSFSLQNGRALYVDEGKTLFKSLEKAPDDAYFLKYLGDLYWSRDRILAAAGCYARAREETKNGMIWHEILTIWRCEGENRQSAWTQMISEGRKENALAEAQLWTRACPEEETARAAYALCRVRAYDKEEAEQSALAAEITEKIRFRFESPDCLSGDPMEASDRRLYRQALEESLVRLGVLPDEAEIYCTILEETDFESLLKIREKLDTASDNKRIRTSVKEKLTGDIYEKAGLASEAADHYRISTEEDLPAFFRDQIKPFLPQKESESDHQF